MYNCDVIIRATKHNFKFKKSHKMITIIQDNKNFIYKKDV